MKPIRILLADDDPLILAGFKAMLDGNEELEIIGEACDGRELLELAKKHSPDIILADINMPGLSGLEALEALSGLDMPGKFIVLSMHEEPEYIHRALRIGAAGYLLKNIERQELHRAIKTVFDGGKYFSPSVITILAQSFSDPPKPEISDLTAREKEVLALVSKGMSTKQIAHSLGISGRTVESHRINMLKKMNVSNTAELVKLAIELKLLE
jgi:DNA-binding NarL/FixJ family response regulator